MTFDKPKVSIDLDEYLHLKRIEEQSKVENNEPLLNMQKVIHVLIIDNQFSIDQINNHLISRFGLKLFVRPALASDSEGGYDRIQVLPIK